MCGIVTYFGRPGNAAKKVLEGLKKLEYRGYDSWGIAVLGCTDGDEITSVKRVGRIGGVNVRSILKEVGGECGVALGHTRWATHGGVSERNCHPQLDCSGSIAVVHNGIIENYDALRTKLPKAHRFISDTDTEIIPHMIEEMLNRKSMDFRSAVRETAKRIRGRSAFVAADAKRGEIAAVGLGAPLIIGIEPRQTGFYISSDLNAFLDETNKVMYIDDNQMALLGPGKRCLPVFLEVNSGNHVYKRIVEVDWKRGRVDKRGYDHFLMKEIMEQKHTIADAINQEDKKMLEIAGRVNRAFGVFLLGSGTSGRVCAAGSYLFSGIAGKHVNSVIASEFRNYEKYLTRRTLVIALSQSGETADVLDAIEMARKRGARVFSLLNVFGSTIMRLSDDFLMLNSGAEMAVASTKVTTAQLSLLTLLAYATAGRLDEGKRLLLNTAAQVNDMLNPRYETRIKRIAKSIAGSKDIIIIGRGLNYPIAEESAIKLQEMCYLHAQGFAGGELKHGPLALVEKGTPCIALISNDGNSSETLGNAEEAKARGAYVIGVSPKNSSMFDAWIKVPDAGNASPIVNIIPVQILAYHIALIRGIDPDYPRNLAKSVTVK
jgi:glucosamine--fructose-6-phosphate aminotransferase (isomerizing)